MDTKFQYQTLNHLDKLVALAERGVVALEKIAASYEREEKPESGIVGMLLSMLPSLVGAPVPEAEVTAEDNQDLCKCMHAKEHHLQGEGPCLLNCPCGAFLLMGKTPEEPKERDTKPDTPRAIRQASHSEMVTKAASQRCSRCGHAFGAHLDACCVQGEPLGSCDCEGFVAA